MQEAGTITVWVLQVLMGLSFVLAGAAKFWAPIWPKLFAEWGYPPYSHLVIGGLEVLGAVALLVPRMAGYGAAGLVVIMAGAVGTQLMHGHGRQWVSPAVLLVL